MIFSPLEQFEIKSLFTINDLMILSVTNYVIYIALVVTLIYGITSILNNVPLGWNRWGVGVLALYDTILNMVKSQVGPRGSVFFPLVFTLFTFIFVANLISMIPYSFAISAQLVAVVSLSISLWLGLFILGLSIHGLGFFALFVPGGTPLILVPVLVLIETLSNVSRAISLGLRLGANVLSGHLLMVILGSLIVGLMGSSVVGFIGGFIPIVAVVAIVCLEFAIAMIQAYVFSILFSGYINDSVNLH